MPRPRIVTIVLLVLATSSCTDERAEVERALLEQQQRDARDRARLARERACTSAELALASEVETNRMRIATLDNELASAERTLEAARTIGRDAGTIPIHEAHVAEVQRELAAARAATAPLTERVRAKQAECARLATP